MGLEQVRISHMAGGGANFSDPTTLGKCLALFTKGEHTPILLLLSKNVFMNSLKDMY